MIQAFDGQNFFDGRNYKCFFCQKSAVNCRVMHHDALFNVTFGRIDDKHCELLACQGCIAKGQKYLLETLVGWNLAQYENAFSQAKVTLTTRGIPQSVLKRYRPMIEAELTAIAKEVSTFESVALFLQNKQLLERIKSLPKEVRL